jgi:hypothetical protein
MLQPSHTFLLKELLHVPAITKKLLSLSKFTRNNNVFFEFHAVDCFVKSQVSKQIFLKGSLGADRLYTFHHLPLHKGPMYLTSSISHSASSTAKDSVASTIASLGPSDTSSVSCHSNKVLYSFIASSSNNNVWQLRLGHTNSKSEKIFFSFVTFLIIMKVYLLFVILVVLASLIGYTLLLHILFTILSLN